MEIRLPDTYIGARNTDTDEIHIHSRTELVHYGEIEHEVSKTSLCEKYEIGEYEYGISYVEMNRICQQCSNHLSLLLSIDLYERLRR